MQMDMDAHSLHFNAILMKKKKRIQEKDVQEELFFFKTKTTSEGHFCKEKQ